MNVKELAGKRVFHSDGNIYYIDSAMHVNNDVILHVIIDNNMYKIKGKVIGANDNIVKLETYKHRKVNTRYISPSKIVGVEIVTNY